MYLQKEMIEELNYVNVVNAAFEIRITNKNLIALRSKHLIVIDKEKEIEKEENDLYLEQQRTLLEQQQKSLQNMLTTDKRVSEQNVLETSKNAL